jgi:hypothetical protein
MKTRNYRQKMEQIKTEFIRSSEKSARFLRRKIGGLAKWRFSLESSFMRLRRNQRQVR